MTEVTIPSKVVSIGSYAFWECKGLMKVTSLIKEPFVISGVFGSYSGEPSKTTLYVPFGTKAKYLEMPGWENFKEIVELEKEEEPEAPYRDGEMFTAEVGNGIELRFTVISAAERTCMLGIPNTLEGEYYPTAFADGSAGKGMGMASMVVAIEIPAKVDGYKVIEIAPQALEASNLTYVTIPTSVTKIGDMAFYSTRIIGLGIPASVTEIGEAILSSVNLRVIAVDGSNPVYDSRSNCNAIIETATNTLILGFEGTTIIEGIEAIGKSAFTWCSPDGGPLEIHIPKTVTQIVDNPFFYNQHTERITVAEDNPV